MRNTALRPLQRWSLLTSLSFLLVCMAIIAFLDLRLPGFLVCAGILLLPARFCQLRLSAAGREITAGPEETEASLDRQAKRVVFWTLYAFSCLSGILANGIDLLFNSKAVELSSYLLSSLFSLMLPLFFLLQSVLMLHYLSPYGRDGAFGRFRPVITRLCLVLSAYCVLTTSIIYLFERIFVLNPYTFFSIVYFLAGTAGYISICNRFLYRKIRLSRRMIAVPALIAALAAGYYLLARDIWLVQPYINSVPNLMDAVNRICYDDDSGIYTITAEREDFRILQLTDIHLGGSVLSYSKDIQALEAVFALLTAAKPDLVVVTGDLTYPVGISSFSINNRAPVMQFASFMRNTGIPWVFAYGNHDTEAMAISSSEDLDTLYRSLSYKTTRNLLYPYTQPDITGRNNQILELRNPDGSLAQVLFILDSNAYMSAGFSEYDYIHDDQVSWYEDNLHRYMAEKADVSSLVFFHIPTEEYAQAYELYSSGSSEVTRLFGENREKVSCSRSDSRLFEAAAALGSSKGFFCGHDHYNNLSLQYQGIQLTYGMSIDYLVEPGIARDTAQRGGTLIISHSDGSVEIEQIPLDSL